MSSIIPLVVICGPTATGKTGLGIQIAKKLNGEIVSADSRQAYVGMDIGTGKDLPDGARFQVSGIRSEVPNAQIGFYQVNNVKIWLHDVISPNEQFSAGMFANIAKGVILDISKRSKLPILVGGSGLYIRSVVDGLDAPHVPADWSLRKNLGALSVPELRKKLKSLNKQKLDSMNQSDRSNPRRLIRAIEIETGRSTTLENKKLGTQQSFRPVFIGLTAPSDILRRRIDRRVETRVQNGIVDEIQRLLKKGYSWDSPGFDTLGYKEWKPCFENGGDVEGKGVESVINAWKRHEHQFAKRQITWFQKDSRIRWFDAQNADVDAVVSYIKSSLSL